MLEMLEKMLEKMLDLAHLQSKTRGNFWPIFGNIQSQSYLNFWPISAKKKTWGNFWPIFVIFNFKITQNMGPFKLTRMLEMLKMLKNARIARKNARFGPFSE